MEDTKTIKQIYEDMVTEFNRNSGFKYELIHDKSIEQKIGFGHGYRTKLTFLKGETRSGHRTVEYMFNHTMFIPDYLVLSRNTLKFAHDEGLNRKMPLVYCFLLISIMR